MMTESTTTPPADFAGFLATLDRAAGDIEALKRYAADEAARQSSPVPEPAAAPLDAFLARVQPGQPLHPTDAGTLAGIGLAVVLLMKSYQPVFAMPLPGPDVTPPAAEPGTPAV
jgi:hypothetical protein